MCLVRPNWSFNRRAIRTSLGVGVFCNTISCPLVHMGHPMNWVTCRHVLGHTLLVSINQCATCYFLLATSLVDLVFRGRCHVSFSYWWCCFKCSNQHPINSGIPHITLLISEIFFLDIHRLEPHLGVSLCLEFFSV